MAMLHRGDAFSLPFTITVGETAVTPDTCSGLAAALGAYTARYEDGGITWDSENRRWLFPVTAEMTDSFGGGDTPFQAAAEFTDGSILHTDITPVLVKDSIIKRVTGNDAEA